MTTRVWALLAVSSEGQADTIGHQAAWAKETAKARGWELERVLGEERDGVGSGKSGPRPIVRRLIAELRALPPANRPTWLLVIRSDRFARGKIQDTLFVQDEIINDLGVRILTRDDGEIMLDTPEAEFMASFKGYYARKDNAVRRDKSTAVYKRKREAGLAVGNKRPYGLVIGPDGHDVIVEDQAETVRRAFALRIEGYGTYAIAQQLAIVAAPYRYKKSGERPVRWSSKRVTKMLENKAYAGTVIDEVTFRRAQQVRMDLGRVVNPPKRTHPWPLSGAIRCWCGYHLVGQRTGKNQAFRYYTCRATWNHDGHLWVARAEPVERQFVDLLTELTQKPNLIDHYRKINHHGPSPAILDKSIRSERAELEAVAKARETVWEAHATGSVRTEDVQERLDTLAGRRDALVASIASLETQRAAALAASKQSGDAAAIISSAARVYVAAEDPVRRRIARAVALQLGGLCVERDRTLSVRWPIDQGAQTRRRHSTSL